jgi:hypothetical protein
VLDCLRKLSWDDLKLLCGLRSDGLPLSNRRVDELVGYSPYIEPMGNKMELRRLIESALPSLKRLEGLGVIYLSDEHLAGIVHEIGPLSKYVQMHASSRRWARG